MPHYKSDTALVALMKAGLFTVVLGGVGINPGDIIFGDLDGLLVTGKGAVESFDKFGIM